MKLGLPDATAACLFDMDGVLTRTATLHAAAWKQMFDEYDAHSDAPFPPFKVPRDYARYVDGKPRLDGTRSFLAARGLELPEGEETDAPGTLTVWGLSNRKNDLVQAAIDRGEVRVYPGTVRYLAAVRAAGLPCAVVTSSANADAILASTGLAASFDARIDGTVARERRLPGKPAPDTFLAAARELGATPAQTAVFEDALAGVSAGRAGGFGFVVGVDRAEQADELRAHGADLVVADLADLLTGADLPAGEAR
ncbi:MAG: HAD family hydrolase [Sporichthyaceae bacterium]|jgi:beta-phosphoglucomutase family hydrolase